MTSILFGPKKPTSAQLNEQQRRKLAEFEQRDRALAAKQKQLELIIRSIPAKGPRANERKRHFDQHRRLQSQREALGKLISSLQQFEHAQEMLQMTKDGVEAMRSTAQVMQQISLPDITEIENVTSENHELLDKIKEASDLISEPFNMDCLDGIDASDDSELDEYFASTGHSEEELYGIAEPSVIPSVALVGTSTPVHAQRLNERYQTLTAAQLAQMPSAPSVPPILDTPSAPTSQSSSSRNPMRQAMRVKS